MTRDHRQTLVYQVRVEGHLERFWLDWFQIRTLTHEPDGTSTLVSVLADHAALYGLLDKLRDLGLPLISLNRVPTASDLESP